MLWKECFMLRLKKAFTLIELMVVVSIIALLAMMLVPALQRALEMTRRASCLANLKGAGTALALYSQANDNIYPMLPGQNWDTTQDGTAWNSKTAAPQGVAADWNVDRSVTSLLFMLIRNGEAPKLFCCPSDSNVTPDGYTTDNNNNGAFFWDFDCGQGGPAPTGIGTARNISYSYECPFIRGTAAADTNGVPVGADSNMVVMSDRTPQLDTVGATFGMKNTPAAFTGASSNPVTTWAANMAPNLLHCFNSQNHTNGEMMNVLYVDGHAARVNNPNCGPTQGNDVTAPGGAPDCIFTASGTHTVTSDGIDYGGTCDNTQHLGTSLRDTFLWGGAGK
jgi:prepilin-type N-terminal cleavage/methylation domain-containing protein/prepilin-type processing-associated H-X9-DG protein